MSGRGKGVLAGSGATEGERDHEVLLSAVRPLTEWYRKNKRDLPWRNQADAYHIWVSEIMLQQTRVEAVKSYYARFLKELPNVKALAEVDEEQLLKLWEGLGYYNRVRNMQKAARWPASATIRREPSRRLPLAFQSRRWTETCSASCRAFYAARRT